MDDVKWALLTIMELEIKAILPNICWSLSDSIMDNFILMNHIKLGQFRFHTDFKVIVLSQASLM